MKKTTKPTTPKLAPKEYFKRLGQLFVAFFKIGAFTFGGGYAMISFITKEMVDKRGWITDQEMLDITAIAESTPGVIAVNTATFVGAKVAGFWGALLASLAVLLPSMVIITVIGYFLDRFKDNQYVKWAFMGVRAAVAALILNAVFKLSKSQKKTWFAAGVFVVALTFALLSSFKVLPFDVFYIILAMALFGILFGMSKRAYQKRHPAPPPWTGETVLPHEEIVSETDESPNKEGTDEHLS